MTEEDSAKMYAKRGKMAYERGDYTQAAEDFKEAQKAYILLGDVINAAEMANNCCVAYLQVNEPEKALQAVEGTPEIFAQVNDLTRQGMALGNYAEALSELDQPDEAIDAYLQSANVFEQAGEDQLRANVLQSLSQFQFQEGRQLEALASMQSGMEGIKKPSPKQRFLKRLLSIPFDMLNKGD